MSPFAAAVQIRTLMYCLSELGLWCAVCAFASKVLGNQGGAVLQYESNKTVDIEGGDEELANGLGAQEKSLTDALKSLSWGLLGEEDRRAPLGLRIIQQALSEVTAPPRAERFTYHDNLIRCKVTADNEKYCWPLVASAWLLKHRDGHPCAIHCGWLMDPFCVVRVY